MTRSEAKARAEAMGAKVAGSVSAKTDLVIAGPRCRVQGQGGGEALGIKIIDEDEWLALAGADMSRPEPLFPLFAELGNPARSSARRPPKPLPRLGDRPPQGPVVPAAPFRRSTAAAKPSLRDVTLPATVTVEVEVGAISPPPPRGRPYRVMVRDAKLEFMLVFFHAKGDYLQTLLPTGQRRIVSGKVELFDGIAQMVHPDHVLRPEEAASLPTFEPVYPLTAGITQKLVAKGVAAALDRDPRSGRMDRPRP